MNRPGTPLTVSGAGEPGRFDSGEDRGGARVVALDALRGIAVAGIALMNVYIFALPPAAYFNPAVAGTDGVLDWLVWALSFVLVEDKFRSLFAMLFGAGVAILLERASGRDAHPIRDHIARMIVLFAIGAAHAILLANNDVLRLYAMAGLFVPLFLGLSSRGLLIAGGTLMAVHAVGGTILAWNWLSAAAGSPDALFAARAFGANPAALDYAQAIGAEGLGERIARRIATFVSTLGTQAPGIPSALGTMLVGAGLWRNGLLRAEWDRARCMTLAGRFAGFALSPLSLMILLDIASGFAPAVVGPVALFWSLPFDLLLAIAYAALVMGIFGRGQTGLRTRLAAVGRLSLTNYLLTSLTFALLFYGWGLGLYGALSRSGALALAFVPIALMLLWSPLWLARYKQGPFEWLWRGIASGRFGAIRRRTGA